MKRRGFLGTLAGLCAVPIAAALPKVTASLSDLPLPSGAFIPLFPGDLGPDLSALSRYEIAEIQAAVSDAMTISSCEAPLTDMEIRRLFTRRFA
jgi:hypothetical protein